MVKESGTVLGSIRGGQDQCDQGWGKTKLEVQMRKHVCGNTTTCSDEFRLVSYYVSRLWMVY